MKNKDIGVPIPSKPRKKYPGFFDGFPSEFYHEILFRSKLEVEWAKYLDFIGVKWEYEPEYFNIDHGRRYTPDFKLYGRYVEVKPSMNNIFDGSYKGQDKFERFVAFGYELIFFVGYRKEKKIFEAKLNHLSCRLKLEEINIVDIIGFKIKDNMENSVSCGECKHCHKETAFGVCMNKGATVLGVPVYLTPVRLTTSCGMGEKL